MRENCKTDYGGKTIVLIVGMLLLLLGGLFFGFTAFTGGVDFSGGNSIIMLGIIGIMIVLGLFVVVMKLRR